MAARDWSTRKTLVFALAFFTALVSWGVVLGTVLR